MIEHYGDTHYGDRANQLDELTEIATLDALETLYRGMSSSYFGKIVSFCANQGIELHLEEEDEISDVLYYADLIDESGRYKRLLMPSIRKAVLFSPLNSVSGGKAFIMEDTLYVSKEVMFKEALFI